MPPSDAKALYKEGFAHFVAERHAEAVACYRRALEIDPGMALGWSALAMALAKQGDLDGAIEAARRLVELEPEEPLGHTSLSLFYQQKGLIPEAEAEKARAMQLGMRRAGR